MRHSDQPYSFWRSAWKRFLTHKLGTISLIIVGIMAFVGLYAPFFASSKPVFVLYDGSFYFPLFRYLFFQGFYTKGIDLFFNALMLTFPLFLLGIFVRYSFAVVAVFIQLVLFFAAFFGWFQDPAADPALAIQMQQALSSGKGRTWDFELSHMSPYAKLNLLIDYRLKKEHHEHLQPLAKVYHAERGKGRTFPTIFEIEKSHLEKKKNALRERTDLQAVQELTWMENKEQWLEVQSRQLMWMVMPFARSFHWEDDAGGQQSLNRIVPWFERTRISRKDLLAGLLFGMRISLVVGVTAVVLALMIGVPLGAVSGFFGGALDIFMSRVAEVWESMPTFFMLLFVVAITQSKSIFLVVSVIGFFGWTGFYRYIRGEFFKQRNLPYVEACQAMGFSNRYTMFVHILPNAIPPLLTLLPFAIMAAITSEAGLSFLGLGEEGSCSWGVLMNEGRAAFPGESYLIWPPAILLSILLIAIALVGDALRDTLDPKMR